MLRKLDLQLNTAAGMLSLISNLIVMICTMAVLLAVLIDFMKFQSRPGVKKETKSIVETGSMMAFFFLFYCLVRFRIGQIDWSISPLTVTVMAIGSALLIVGAIVNIRGRLRLGKNWANQVVIYQDQTLITTDIYGLVRHPLYASLIWMFAGASLVYGNYLAFLANAIIFVPFMTYRAKQEERSLANEFNNYNKYQQKVGMFFPKLFRKS